MRHILTVMLTLAALTVAAQERFDEVVRRNPWNGGVNASGIRMDTLSRSYAELFFTKTNGALADPSASDDSWNAGAVTESVRHFAKVSFSGGFAYNYFDGKNMCGSMFTRPGYYPVDIVEFTPGRKIREDYSFRGGVSAVLGQRWTGGIGVDFSAHNYAKRKDLRHKNLRLDFEFTPSVLYHTGRWSLGASYIVGTNSEKVEAETRGAATEQYEAFFDRGLRYGVLEQWMSNDIHLAVSGVSGFPVRENVQGAGLQLGCGAFYADVEYRNRAGKTGESRLIWQEFDTDQITSSAVLSLGEGALRHFLRLHLDWRSLQMSENIITTESVNGVTNSTIHGSVPTFGRKSLDLNLEYELWCGRNRVRAAADFSQTNRRSTLMFPSVREQKLRYVELRASWLRTLGRWELMLGADFRRGDTSEHHYELDGGGEHSGAYPVRLTSFYQMENEYLTAARLGGELSLRRHIHAFYVDLSAAFEHGFNLKYLPQPNRVGVTLRVGYNF